MSMVTMKPMLERAKQAKYGIGAFNMIDYNSARAIVDGANELNAPVIIQVSVKTIKLWGHAPIASWVRELASKVDIPVALHLDHCKDLDVIKGCIAAGWTSVMFDGSALPFEENLAQTRVAYDLATAAGLGLEAELGAIGGTEDDKFVAQDDAILANVDECISFCRELPELAVFAPAIGTAHGFYEGQPNIAYDRLGTITENIDIPIALHGGTGLTDDQFHRCINSGCSKINISAMHKRRYIDSFVSVREIDPTGGEPIKFINAQYDALKSDVKAMIRVFGSAAKAADAQAAYA